jgi:hypothetical protein
MTNVLTIIAILLPFLACAQVTNVTFRWDPRPAGEAVNLYRLWETNASGWTLRGQSTTNQLTVTNYDIAIPHAFSVTASNAWGESPRTNVVTIPVPAGPPANLQPVPLSLVLPVPGTAQVSFDLVHWSERIRVEPASPGSVFVTYRKLPTEPAAFLRVQPAPSLPPTP